MIEGRSGTEDGLESDEDSYSTGNSETGDNSVRSTQEPPPYKYIVYSAHTCSLNGETAPAFVF